MYVAPLVSENAPAIPENVTLVAPIVPGPSQGSDQLVLLDE